MGESNEKSLKGWVLAAPIVFSLHFLEEAPGFVDWANTHIDQGISQKFFIAANFFVLCVTSGVALVMTYVPSTRSASVLILWLGFMMFGNGVLHITAALLERGYVPGLITAMVLYIPYYILLVKQLATRRYLTFVSAILLTLIGAVPMAIQGYLVFFQRSRLW